MNQLVTPDEYSELNLRDQFIEDIMQKYELAWLLKHTQVEEKILDMGYGSGIICKGLHDAKRNVTLIDGSQKFVSEAVRYGIKGNTVLFQHFQAPYKYDTVIASFVLEHVQDPTSLLMKMKDWADRLIVVVGNANSYHRQLAVAMGLQPELDTLSARDHQVGHYRVYDMLGIETELLRAGWRVKSKHGLMFKPLPNSMLAQYDTDLIEAMCKIHVPVECAANIILTCQKS